MQMQCGALQGLPAEYLIEKDDHEKPAILLGTYSAYQDALQIVPCLEPYLAPVTTIGAAEDVTLLEGLAMAKPPHICQGW